MVWGLAELTFTSGFNTNARRKRSLGGKTEVEKGEAFSFPKGSSSVLLVRAARHEGFLKAFSLGFTGFVFQSRVPGLKCNRNVGLMLSEEKAFSLQGQVDVDDTKLISAVDTLEGCST